MKRRTFIKEAGVAAGLIAAAPLLTKCTTTEEYPFPLVDLHVHTTNEFTLDAIMKIAKERNVKFGIVDHPADWALKNDADLTTYLDKLDKYPVYKGLQPMITGWQKRFSPEVMARLDYVLMEI